MGFVGRKPTNAPLTSSDLGTGIVGSANIADGTIANADIANSTINLTTKVTGTLPVANGGTGLATLGTASQELRVNSGATALEYYTPTVASSDFVKLATSTISGSVSTISLDGYFSSTYKYYKLFISDFGVTATYKTTFLRLRRSNADVTASNYTYGFWGNASSGSFNATSTTSIPIGYEMQADSALGRLYGELTFYNPSDTTSYKYITGNLSIYNSQFSLNNGTAIKIGLKDSTSALSGFTIYTDGTFETDKGTITLYGIK